MFKKINLVICLYLLIAFHLGKIIDIILEVNKLRKIVIFYFLSFLELTTATAPVVSWYFRGSAAANGTSLSVNSQSALVLGCTATSTNILLAATGTTAIFILSKSSVITSYTITKATGTAGISLTASGGTIFFDSITGNRAGYDHIIVSTHFAVPYGTTNPINGYLGLYIPSLATTDAGTYYCTYIDGSDDAEDTTAAPAGFNNSGSFTLTVTTKSGSGTRSVASSRNKALEYSLVLLGASKVLF